MDKITIIDGNSLLFRAYFATAFAGTDKILRNKEGYPTNAMFGLANIITKVLNTETPDYALVAFDTNKPTFRHLEYKDYKAGRAQTPVELIQQFKPAREMLKLMGLFVYEIEGYEADDIIGTTSRMVGEDFDVDIYSADKDLLQLIKENVKVCLTKKGVSDLNVMTIESLKEQMGVTPSQITDLKGLMGDESDNIPGVRGVGEKTAVKLIQEYGCVENIVNASIGGKLGEKISEDKQIALDSKRLATIKTDVPVTYTLEDLKYTGPDSDNLSLFLRKFDMFSLDRKLTGKKVSSSTSFEIVDKIPSEFLNQDLGLYIDVNGANYHFDTIIGLSLSNANKTYFINRDDILNDKDLINYLCSDKYCKYCFDIKSTICICNRLNIKPNGLVFDLLLGTYLLESLVKDDPIQLFSYYNILISDRPKENSEDHNNLIANYISQIASNTYKLKDIVIGRLEKANQLDLFYNVEIKLSKILANMEMNGVLVDKELFKNKCDELNEKINKLTKEIYQFAGEEFNINSPSQLATILFDKLNLPSNKKRSTSIEELEVLRLFHPIIDKIIEYRKYAKLISVYFGGLQEYIASDNRIHTTYNQSLTQTGRLSSREPNLQNISVRDEEGKEVRKGFIAPENKLLISFDYSQIELRVLADMANSNSLRQAFINDVDVHKKTASLLFGVDINSVNEVQRRQAKTINFGIVYGMSHFELARDLGIGFNKAKEFIDRYFEMYPEIKTYFSTVIEKSAFRLYN